MLGRFVDRELKRLYPSYTVRQIEEKLHLSLGTTQRDITYWRKISDEEMHEHFKTLPLKIMQGIELTEITIEWLSDIIESEDSNIDLDTKMQASRDRLAASEYRDKLLDGKARLNEAFRRMDSIKQNYNYKTLDLTGIKPKVLKDDNALSEHS